MRYSTTTRLRPGQVFARAREFFGPEGKVGLEITERGLNRMVFAGGGGYVIVNAGHPAGGTPVELEVWEFDQEARSFLASLPGPEGWLGRVWGSWRRERASDERS